MTRFFSKLMKTNLKASLALRGAFFMQMIFMIINNLIFFVTWWILLKKYDSINGWELKDLQAVYAMAAGSFGITVILFSGARDLSEKIISGSLDTYLVQPKNPLLHVIASRSTPSGWGDIISSILLFHWAGYLTWPQLPVILTTIICSTIVMTALLVILNSLPFWLGNMENFQNQIFEFLILFSTYPSSIFGGWIKVVLFTVIPAGFVAYLPVEILRNFSWRSMTFCIAAAAVYMLAAQIIFRQGLKKYESGNLI